MCIKQKSFKVKPRVSPWVGKVQRQDFLGGLESISGTSGFSHQNVKMGMYFLAKPGDHRSILGPEEHDRRSKQNPSPVRKTWVYVRARPTASETLLKVDRFSTSCHQSVSSRNYGQD